MYSEIPDPPPRCPDLRDETLDQCPGNTKCPEFRGIYIIGDKGNVYQEQTIGSTLSLPHRIKQEPY